MQGMMGNPAMQQNPGMMGNPAMQQGGAAPNAFQQRIQQFMNDPAMMQRAMAMTQQMWNAQQGQAQGDASPMGGFNPGALGGPPPIAPTAPTAPTAQAGDSAPINPMQQMMQAMMANPAMMPQMNAGQQG